MIGRPTSYTPEIAQSLGATDSKVEIYALSDPITGRLRYVGKANNSKKRLASHIRDSRRRNTPVCCWIRALAAKGQAPVLTVLELVPSAEWQDAERRLIAEYRVKAKLLNVADGGDDQKCPEATRKDNAKYLRIDPSIVGAAVINQLRTTLKTWHGSGDKRPEHKKLRSRELRTEAFSHIESMIKTHGVEQTAVILVRLFPWLARYAG
jgi:hypothetical protein